MFGFLIWFSMMKNVVMNTRYCMTILYTIYAVIKRGVNPLCNQAVRKNSLKTNQSVRKTDIKKGPSMLKSIV